MDVENRNTGERAQTLSEDVAAVFRIIKEFRAGQLTEEKSQNKRSRKETIFKTLKVLAFASVLIFILALTLIFSSGSIQEKARLTVQVIIISSYIGAGAAILMQFRSPFFKDPTGDIMDEMGEYAAAEVGMFKEFDQLSTESIQYVAKRLQSSSTQLDRLRSFLVGSIEKIGVIPGLLASVLALSKVVSSGSGFSWLEALSVVLMLLYFMMFPLMEASIKFERLALILEEYLERGRKGFLND